MMKSSNILGTTKLKATNQKPAIPWSCLATLDESVEAEYAKGPDPAPGISEVQKGKSFAQALKATCDISISQLPQPCIKGDAIAIKIPEEEYQAGLQRCKTHLHGRLILSKGDSPIRFTELRTKLQSLWNMIGAWNMISLGRGFYEFAFASMEDMRTICAVGSWSLKPGFLRLSLWSPDFNPSLQKVSHSQCWVRIFGLPLEYWSPKILFSIAGGLGVPISLDEATSNRSFGHFARIWVDVDLKGTLPSQILVEREGFAFFVHIEYENLPAFCSGCQVIGHLISSCRRNKDVGAEIPRPTLGRNALHPKDTDPGKGQKVNNNKTEMDNRKEVVNKAREDDLVIELEFENNVNMPPEIVQKEGIPSNLIDEDCDLQSTSDEDTRETRVEETQENEVIQLIPEERCIVQQHDQMCNDLAARETRIVGRLWADEEEEVNEELEDNSPARGSPKEGTLTKALSKSQKKKLRQKQSLEKVHFTRRGGYLNVSK
ncbi:PREDICTED: uncharacterized protein LOC109339775 [Lupinus angustifolius]|uniref:uncharacterized protein LOC109339775 n=1 Tax=Lupinus angustifolius TaxID=3871 RepID=UPI00092E2855|nr:PREDICTED: uncharacterized protein LOC109339775 [Lupinus angustifolius]